MTTIPYYNQMNPGFKNIIIFLFFLGSSTCSIADTLIMKDGSVLNGKLLQQRKNTLKFKTSYAGTINVKWDQVKKLTADKAVTIMLVTDEVFSAQEISNIGDDISQIKKQDEQWHTAFKTHNVSYINPEPWRLGNGYKISANLNLSLKSQHGNTVKDEFDLDGELKFRSLTDRYIILAQLENDTSNKKTSADNWKLSSEYDYFVSKQRYYGALLYFERDRFTDLEMRTVLGPLAGRQYYESKELNLSTNVGMVKVYENNIKADDSDYMAFLWNVKYDQFVFDKFTQLYHRQTGIWDWEKTQKVTLNSWTGLRFPLNYGLVASTEVEWEYDSEPKQNVHKSDITYRFKLGYQW